MLEMDEENRGRYIVYRCSLTTLLEDMEYVGRERRLRLVWRWFLGPLEEIEEDMMGRSTF